MRWLLVLIVACSGGGKTPPIGGSGSGPAPAACEDLRAKVQQLYRAEAEVKEPKRIDDAVADNTQMVMNDCAKDPTKVSACVKSASTIAEIEAKCLRPLDDEGSEGNELK